MCRLQPLQHLLPAPAATQRSIRAHSRASVAGSTAELQRLQAAQQSIRSRMLCCADAQLQRLQAAQQSIRSPR